MRVMVIVKATKDSEVGMMPETEMLEAMGKYNEELVNAGILLDGDGLKPSTLGKRVAFDGPSRTVIDGPFAETRELVAGYWMWEVKDMAEAVEWVKRCPNPMPGPSEIEIRPFYNEVGSISALGLGGGGDGASKLRVGSSPNPMRLARWFRRWRVGTRSRHNICLPGARRRGPAGYCRSMRRPHVRAGGDGAAKARLRRVGERASG